MKTLQSRHYTFLKYLFIKKKVQIFGVYKDDQKSPMHTGRCTIIIKKNFYILMALQT